MKRFWRSIRLLIVVVILLGIAGVTVLAATGKATGNYLRIRKTASTDSEVLGVLAEGDTIEILGEEGDWYKISAKGYTGYVSKAYISLNNETNNQVDNSTNSENNTSPEDITTITKVYKVAENTQVYILPILSSEVIGNINVGDEIDLINSAGLWGYVKTKNISGWVRIDKLSYDEIKTTTNENVTTENNSNNNSNENKTNQEGNSSENNSNKDASSQVNAENGNNLNSDNANGTTTENNEEQNNNSTEENTQQNETTKSSDVAIDEKTMYVSATSINVRKEPNTTSDVISCVEINKEFKVVAENNGWYKVNVNGGYGYIRKDLLSDKKTEVTSRSNSVERTQNNNTSNAQTSTQATQDTNKSSVPVSSSGVSGNDIVAYAKKFVGCKYVYGAAGPSSFDCSGLTMYVYKHFGYSLSHSSRVQATQGVAVNGELQPGDILAFTNDGVNVGHVGIYIGNDKFIHASDSTTGVIISNLHDSWNIKKYVGARRILK